MDENAQERRLKERCMRYETRIAQLIEAYGHLLIGIQGCAIHHPGERKLMQQCVDEAQALISEGSSEALGSYSGSAQPPQADG